MGFITVFAFITAAVLYIRLSNAKKKIKLQERLLFRLFHQGKVSALELIEADVKIDKHLQQLPPMGPQPGQPYAPPVPPPGAQITPVQQITEIRALTETPPEQPLTAPVTETATTAEHVTETATTTEPVTESAITAEHVTEIATTAEPVTETAPTTEPATESASTAEPVTETATTAEPVTESATIAETVTKSAPTKFAELPENALPQFTAPVFSAPPVPQKKHPSLKELFKEQLTPDYDEEPTFQISAISVMLSVGVVLIIVAALLFVRSNWESLSNFGRLAMLAAGSVLFFGTSTLARKAWKLERTGMAFFTLGAAFLPISIWAAGYFGLLGDGLSGAGNKWLICLSFVSFTVIAGIAVRIYNQKSWAIASMAGASFGWFYLVYAFTDVLEPQLPWAMLLFSVYATAFAFVSRRVAARLPEAYAVTIEPFALGLVIAAAIPYLALIGQHYSMIPAGLAALVLAAAYLAPALCGRLQKYTAIPTGFMTLLGFLLLMLPLVQYKADGTHVLCFGSYAAASNMFAASVCIGLLLWKQLRQDARTGFRYGGYLLAAISVPFHLFAVQTSWIVALATALLTAMLLLAVKSTPGKQICAACSGMAWLFCGDIGLWLRNRFAFTQTESYLTVALLCLIAFAGFYWKKRLRNLPGNLLFTVSAAGFSILALCGSTIQTWQIVCAFCMIAISAALCYLLALHPRTRDPWHAVYAALTPFMLYAGVLTAWGSGCVPLSDAAFLLLAAAVSILCSVLFFQPVRLRHPAPNILFPCLTGLCLCPLFAFAHPVTWQIITGMAAVFLTAGLCYRMALHAQTAHPFTHIYAYLGAAVLLFCDYGWSAGSCFHLNESDYLIIGALLCMLCFVMFFRSARLRSIPAHTVFPCGAVLIAMAAFWFASPMPWETAVLLILAAGIAVLYYAFARSAHTKEPVCRYYGALMSAVLLHTNFTVWANDVFSMHQPAYCLITAAVCGVCFAAFRSQPRLRNIPADLLFPCGAAAAALFALTCPSVTNWQIVLCLLIPAAVMVLYWQLAFAKDTCEPHQHAYAALVPLTLYCTFCAAAEALPNVSTNHLNLLMTVLALGIAFAVLFTVRSSFHSVRATMFALSVIPIMILAFTAPANLDGEWVIVQQLLCAAAAAAFWLLFAKRGIRIIPTAGFAVSLMLLMLTTGYAVSTYVYDGDINFTVCMTASAWLIPAGGAAFAIRRELLSFTGCKVIPPVAQKLLTFTAICFSFCLLSFTQKEWNSFYFIYTAGICLLAWFTSAPEQIALPAVTAASMLFSCEALRAHTDNGTDGFVALTIFVLAGLTALLPYLGIVERENEAISHRRSYVLTVFGGLMPFWLLYTVSGHDDVQCRWIIFFVPVLLAGYILHGTFLTKNEITRRKLFTAAAALCTLALWIQPLVDTADTYWDGKLHLLPLIAFGTVIRILYGEQTGSIFLFGIGIYSLGRLAISAAATESAADLATVLLTALLIFIVSFYVKQKKWFLLGGISLLVLAVYMDIKISNELHWWAFLLFAGILLIVIAAMNETLKARGDSLKERAGRFWEDWTW